MSVKSEDEIWNWILHFYEIPEALDMKDSVRWSAVLLCCIKDLLMFSGAGQV